MSAIRKQIRQALVNALSGVGATIYKSRTYPVKNLPAVSVYTPTETREAEGVTLTAQSDPRELTITLELRVKEAGDVEDTLDDLASLVVAAVVDDPALLALVDVIQYDDYQTTLVQNQELPAALGVVTLTAYFRTVYNNPDQLN